jgi:hypothetical protein
MRSTPPSPRRDSGSCVSSPTRSCSTTFGTLAVQVWPVTDVQAYMGHADIKTTMRYVHHVPKHDAAERFSRFVAAQSVSPMSPEHPTSVAPGRNSAQLEAA